MDISTNLLLIGRDLSLYDSLKKVPLPPNCSLYFCSRDGDILSSLKNNEIKIALIELLTEKKEENTLLKKLKKYDPLLEVLIVGDPTSPEEVMGWVSEGATEYLAKPLQGTAILEALSRIQEKWGLRRETFQLERKLEKKYIFQGMVSKNPRMLEIFALIENIAKYFSCVLISGETGTGKELVARAIHNLSPASNRKLVICDCASIPDSLFESELFGYVRGAFTGAEKDKRGLFEEAHQGAIFLDEISEIPVSIQAKLLRVLETHQFRPLGSTADRAVDVRVIAATNRDLAESIKASTFREDLFHRLNKLEIHLPPLRERPEDIAPLARHFLDVYNARFSKKLKGVSRDVQKIFLRYSWTGNIRELANVLESAAMLCQKDFIELDSLPKYLRDFLPGSATVPFIQKEKLSTLEDLEKDYIAYLLKRTNNNLRQSARILGVSRTTLYNKLRKYKLKIRV